MTEDSNKCQSSAASLCDLLISILISSECEEVTEECNAVAMWQIEAGRVWSDGFSNNGRIVKDPIDHFGCDLSDLSRINVVCE
jgi:hypothetical protein